MDEHMLDERRNGTWEVHGNRSRDRKEVFAPCGNPRVSICGSEISRLCFPVVHSCKGNSTCAQSAWNGGAWLSVEVPSMSFLCVFCVCLCGSLGEEQPRK